VQHAGISPLAESELARVVACIDSSGGIEYTRERAREESRAAIEALAPVPASHYRDALAQLAAVTVDRDR
jgi:octaprenyl-diphosphate synthase